MKNINAKDEYKSSHYENENSDNFNRNCSFSTKNKDTKEILNPFESDKQIYKNNLTAKEHNPKIEEEQENSRDRSKSDLDNFEINSKIDSKSSTIMIQEMDLPNYKTKHCTTNNALHNPKHCPYYHTMADRRRVNEDNLYSPDKCAFYEKGNCPNGDSCKFSHNSVERVYHHLQYKAKFCSKYLENIHSCEYGSYCGFAHNENEIRTPLIHKLKKDEEFYMFYFKTVWCPFNHDHNKAACVYAHNCQDFRRRPNLFFYSSENCHNWKNDTYIKSFSEGCIHHEYCVYSHGWKEQAYHPLYYKTKLCPDELKCLKSPDCFYFHSSKDRRNPERNFLYSSNHYLLPKLENLIIWNNINDIQEYWNKMNKDSIHFSPNIIKRIKSIQTQKMMPHSIISEFKNDFSLGNSNKIKKQFNELDQIKSIRKNTPIELHNWEREIDNEAKNNEKIFDSVDVFDGKDLNEEEKAKILTYKAPIFNQIKSKNEIREMHNISSMKPKKVSQNSSLWKIDYIMKKFQKAAMAISNMEPEFFKNDEKILPILKIIQN